MIIASVYAGFKHSELPLQFPQFPLLSPFSYHSYQFRGAEAHRAQLEIVQAAL